MCVRPLMMRPVTLLLVATVAVCALAQNRVVNPGFESGSPGAQPPGWFVPQPSTDAGYTVVVSSEGAKEGKQCAVLSKTGSGAAGFGNMMQSVDAQPFRGKRVKFRAAVRFEKAGDFGQCQLWMRVDRKNGEQGFFNNMGDRPVRTSTWAFYEIVGDVAADAESVNFGMLMVGSGSAFLDAASLGEASGATTAAAPPKALTDRGLENLVAFTKLLGTVRHFHPSDAVERADWEVVAYQGVTAVEGAKDATELAQKLEAWIRPLAPTVRVFPSGSKPPLSAGLKPTSDADKVVVWENVGFGGGTVPKEQNIYRSRRKFVDAPGGKVPEGTTDPGQPFEADLGGGVSCSVPLALFAKGETALPVSQVPEPGASKPEFSGDDRTTRLAAAALGWNVFQHFYPYFDVVKVDWPGVLRRTLTAAATDAGARAFLDTLRTMVASAKDGHGYVAHTSDDRAAQPPIAVTWVDEKLIVTVAGAEALGLKPGDEIQKIDGRSVSEAWKKLEPTISGATPQWRRYRALGELLAGPDGSTVSIEAVHGSGAAFTVSLPRSSDNRIKEPRPAAIEEIRPGIWYVDLDGPRADPEAYFKKIPDLAKAKGLIFDMRGYPNQVAMDVLKRLSDKPVTSALWNVPVFMKPDQEGVDFVKSRWPEEGPIEPRFKAKTAFLTDGRAISYAESVMGIVEAYKLGDIVGGTTAGTNGNIDPFRLPGGYTVVFTGMKVLKHDGSVHHGVGIAPTVPVSRTVNGIRAKRDEVLEKAIETVSAGG
ncbi:MAG: peptidase S41 [Armatimonadetes bacterium]|nr:peptidase S41 [Armatimonadota bacterium]